jgi:hypothetical protein
MFESGSLARKNAVQKQFCPEILSRKSLEPNTLFRIYDLVYYVLYGMMFTFMLCKTILCRPPN